jgi:hypothetical protein
VTAAVAQGHPLVVVQAVVCAAMNVWVPEMKGILWQGQWLSACQTTDILEADACSTKLTAHPRPPETTVQSGCCPFKLRLT